MTGEAPETSGAPDAICSVGLGEGHHWVHHHGPYMRLWIVQCSLCRAFNWEAMREQEAVLAEQRDRARTSIRDIAAAAIATERERQQTAEGYTVEHDREHGADLVRAAHAYELCDRALWPWRDGWRPRSRVRDLVRAGALHQAAADVAPHDASRARHEYARERVTSDLAALLQEARDVLDGAR